jgi:hypothetical protein
VQCVCCVARMGGSGMSESHPCASKSGGLVDKGALSGRNPR